MKLNKLFLAVMTAGVLFSSCEQTFTPEPSPAAPTNAQEVYFQTPDMTGMEIDPDANVTEYPIVIQRADSTAALTVALVVLQNDKDVYNVPSSYTFEAGVGTGTLVVGLNAMEAGVTHNLLLQIDPTIVNPYAVGAENAICQLSITPIKWEAGVGVYHDMLVPGGYSSIPVTAWYVDYKLANLPDGSAKICVSAPYAKLPAGGAEADATADADGIYDAFIYFFYNTGAEDLTFYIDANGVVTFNDYEIGCDFGYGSVFGALYKGGTGVYTPGVSVTFPDGAMVVGEAGVPYAYANLSLYLTKEAYLEATAVEAIDAEVSDYEGTFALNATDFEGTAVEETVVITSYEDEMGQYYAIEGIPSMNPVFGMFDAKSHLMHIPVQQIESIYDEAGVEYEVIVYTMTSDGYTSTEDLVLAYNGDGTISIDASSKVIGLTAIAFSTVNEEEYFFLDNGYFALTLTATEAPAAVAPKHTAKRQAMDYKQLVPRKKMEIARK